MVRTKTIVPIYSSHFSLMAIQHGKKYNQAVALVEKDRAYSLAEALELLDRTNTVKFDPTIEIHFNLGIDPRQADQIVRSTLTLPNGTGKTKRIAAFTETHDAELRALGVAVVGGDDLIDEVIAGKINFDIAIATPAMMRKMGKVAKILGPKGLMPNPKAGTVGEDLVSISKELLAGRFEYKNDKQGNIHSIVGKLSFGSEKLGANINHFISAMKGSRPTGLKGSAAFIKSVYLCSAMGPGILLDMNSL